MEIVVSGLDMIHENHKKSKSIIEDKPKRVLFLEFCGLTPRGLHQATAQYDVINRMGLKTE